MTANTPSFEFSDKVDRSRREFVFSAVIYFLFVSFEVKESSNIIGFDVSQVSDYRLELFSYIMSLVLFFNYFIRMASEATTFYPFKFATLFEHLRSTEEKNHRAMEDFYVEFDKSRETVRSLQKIDFKKIVEGVEDDLKTYAHAKTIQENKSLIDKMISEGRWDDLTEDSHRRSVEQMMERYKDRTFQADREFRDFYETANKIEKLVGELSASNDALIREIKNYNNHKKELRTTGTVFFTISSQDFRLIMFEILIPSTIFLVCSATWFSSSFKQYFISIHL